MYIRSQRTKKMYDAYTQKTINIVELIHFSGPLKFGNNNNKAWSSLIPCQKNVGKSCYQTTSKDV